MTWRSHTRWLGREPEAAIAYFRGKNLLSIDEVHPEIIQVENLLSRVPDINFQ